MSKRDFMTGAGVLGMAGLAGTAFASSSGKAGAQGSSVFNVREFGAEGEYTPQVGFILRKLSYSVIANNVGCPMR